MTKIPVLQDEKREDYLMRAFPVIMDRDGVTQEIAMCRALMVYLRDEAVEEAKELRAEVEKQSKQIEAPHGASLAADQAVMTFLDRRESDAKTLVRSYLEAVYGEPFTDEKMKEVVG